MLTRGLPAIAVTGALMTAASTAQAVNCHSFSCFNRALNRMQAKLNRDDQLLSAIAKCFQEYPVGIFGNRDGSFGYSYNDGTKTFNTTALDASLSGDPVNAWLFGDKCNSTKTATAHISSGASAAFAPWAPVASWPSPLLRP
jgi:hypothetical protein